MSDHSPSKKKIQDLIHGDMIANTSLPAEVAELITGDGLPKELARKPNVIYDSIEGRIDQPDPAAENTKLVRDKLTKLAASQ